MLGVLGATQLLLELCTAVRVLSLSLHIAESPRSNSKKPRPRGVQGLAAWLSTPHSASWCS